MTDFISNFVLWMGQFVGVSIVLIIVTHLFAKKRREQKRHEQLLSEDQGDDDQQSVQAEEANAVMAG